MGEEPHLHRRSLRCAEVVLRDPGVGTPGLLARTRYRHPGTAVESWTGDASRADAAGAWPPAEPLEVRLAAPDRAPAPGQAVVFDRGGIVVGGGRLLAQQNSQDADHEVG